MMEFGSDFHKIDYPKGHSFERTFKDANFYASGRQALMALVIARKWKRLWVPSYFCEESLNCFHSLEIDLKVYPCNPFSNPKDCIDRIGASTGEGILVVNYFGIYSLNEFDTEAEIVEDHTHDLIGEWSMGSSAEWCIASLRKTLPIPDGGILWSPKGFALPSQLETIDEWNGQMRVRFDAMARKSSYLKGEHEDKNEYLRLLRETEDAFDTSILSGISGCAKPILSDFDIETWCSMKRTNFEILEGLVTLPASVVLLRASKNTDTLFSFCLLFPDRLSRDKVRRFLIDHSVYPAVLWNIQADYDTEAKSAGDRVLSIHCDGRYSREDMCVLAKIINDSLRSLSLCE